MIAMMMMTFLLFFMFVVNTGMLVNAKINIQNAADLAAYAGAAVQARQLNHISYLNYEMRRQYKKFLYRYYVVGSMSQKLFPRAGANGTGKYKFSPDGVKDIRMPATCFIFNNKDNFCQIASLQPITIPPNTVLDNINNTLRTQLQNIETIRQKQCIGIGMTNTQVLFFWLFNTDPNHNDLAPALAAAEPTNKGMLEATKTLSLGLGLVPREVLTKFRIQTLAYYVNFANQKNVNLDAVNTLKGQGDVAARERTIQAFLSAYNTLGNNTFDSDSIIMDEMLPSAGKDAALLLLKDINIGFDTYAIDMRIGGTCDTSKPADPNPKDNGPDNACASCATPLTIPLGSLPMGVIKDPTVLTFYALRMTAKAHLLFSPFGDVKLKAYAAAMPFGSRIGPRLTADSFVTPEGNPDFCAAVKNASAACANVIPNLAVQKGDDLAQGGWGRESVMAAMYQKFNPESEAGKPGSLNPKLGVASFNRAYQAAMVPNPAEQGQYNIINDLGDSFVKNFDDGGLYAFWAPLISKDKQGDKDAVNNAVRDMIDKLGTGPGDGTAKKTLSDNVKTTLKDGFKSYISALQQSKGTEDDETFSIARLRDPFKTIPEGGAKPQQISLPDTIMMANPKDVKTSWNGVKDAGFQEQGRVGYSVKIVSFKTLMEKGGVTSDGNGTVWSNKMETDGDADADLPFIQH